MANEAAIQAWRQNKIDIGFKPEMVDSYIASQKATKQAEIEDISGIISGVKSGAITKDVFDTLPAETRKTVINQLGSLPNIPQEKGLSDTKPTPIFGQDVDPIKEVYSQDGGDLLTGTTLGEKKAQAKAIMDAGGVQAYRKNASYRELLRSNDNLQKANDAAQSLLSMVNDVQIYLPPGTKNDFLGKGNLTGPVVGRLPGFLSSEEGIQARQAISTLFTNEAKLMSGVAINPEELKRMKVFLPSITHQEKTNAIKADQLDRSIRMNMKVREDALRNGVTVGEQWIKNKDNYYRAFGFNPGNPRENISSESSESKELLDTEDEALIMKYQNAGQ